jgi:hypothetical protein
MHLEYVKKAAKCKLTLHYFSFIAIMITSFTNYIVSMYQVYFAYFCVSMTAAILTVCLKTLNLSSDCREIFCCMLQCDTLLSLADFSELVREYILTFP